MSAAVENQHILKCRAVDEKHKESVSRITKNNNFIQKIYAFTIETSQKI